MTLTEYNSRYKLTAQQSDMYEVLNSLSEFCYKKCGHIETRAEWWLYGQYVAFEYCCNIIDSKTYNLIRHVCDIRNRMFVEYRHMLDFKDSWGASRIAKQEGVLAGYERALLIITQITSGETNAG